MYHQPLTIAAINRNITEKSNALKAQGFRVGPGGHITFEKDAAHNYGRSVLHPVDDTTIITTIPENTVHACLYLSSYEVCPNTFGHPQREYVVTFDTNAA